MSEMFNEAESDYVQMGFEFEILTIVKNSRKVFLNMSIL